VRTGAVVAIDGDARRASSGDHDPHKDLVRTAIDREIAVALDAVAHLASTPRGPAAGTDLRDRG
jgi:hypothetical protein